MGMGQYYHHWEYIREQRDTWDGFSIWRRVQRQRAACLRFPRNKVTIQSPVVIEESDGALEGWDTDSGSSSSAASTLPVITVSTPLPPLRWGITVRTPPPPPLTGPPRDLLFIFRLPFLPRTLM